MIVNLWIFILAFPALAGWERSNGNNASNRYSSLEEINARNVTQLKPAWTYHSGIQSPRNQGNPVIIGKTAYFPAGPHTLVAVDAVTGKEKWKFEGESPLALRGLVYGQGRIYFSSGRGIRALDAETGKPVLTFGTNGKSGDALSFVAPAIVGDKIFTATMSDGNNPPEFLAMELLSGKILWRTKLRDPKSQFPGGNPWSGFSVDEKRNIAFLTTGNPQPQFEGINRPGSNIYSDSVIAIDLRNGEIKWSFQEIAHDIWDKDISSPPLLTQIKRGKKTIDVVVATTKLGNTIVLNRDSGKSIYPWTLKKAPASTVPGEQTAPMQPDIKLPEPFAKQHYKDFFEPPKIDEDVIHYGFMGGAEWPGGVVNPDTSILYVASSDAPTLYRLRDVTDLTDSADDGSFGSKIYHNKCVGCHSVVTKLDIIPLLYNLSEKWEKKKIHDLIQNGHGKMPGFAHIGSDAIDAVTDYIHQNKAVTKIKPLPNAPRKLRSEIRKYLNADGTPASDPPWGKLSALDLNTGKILWQKPLGDFQDKKDIGAPNLGAPLVTKGNLIFVTGTLDKKIRAFDQRSGDLLWTYELPASGHSAPATYEVDGEQYLLVPATGIGELSDSFIAFKIFPK